MTIQTEEGIDLRPKMALIVPRATFDAIIAEVKEKQASTKQLAEEFNYSTLAISFIRSRAIALGLLPRPIGTEKMMQVKEAKRMMGLYTKKSSNPTTKEVSRNIRVTTPIQKDSLPTSKFVNIKFGEMEVVVEKSASIVITKEKIIIN